MFYLWSNTFFLSCVCSRASSVLRYLWPIYRNIVMTWQWPLGKQSRRILVNYDKIQHSCVKLNLIKQDKVSHQCLSKMYSQLFLLQCITLYRVYFTRKWNDTAWPPFSVLPYFGLTAIKTGKDSYKNKYFVPYEFWLPWQIE